MHGDQTPTMRRMKMPRRIVRLKQTVYYDVACYFETQAQAEQWARGEIAAGNGESLDMYEADSSDFEIEPRPADSEVEQ